MSASELFSPIKAFLQAIQDGKPVEALSLLERKAALVGAGSAIQRDALKSWAETVCEHASFAIHLTDRGGAEEATVLTLQVCKSRNETVDTVLQWRFHAPPHPLLTIRLETKDGPVLPAAVEAYIRATNEHDLDALLDTFVDDALVNDQLCDYWGRRQIRDWASRDIIGERLTMRVVHVTRHYGDVIATAHVDGEFDKRGLPDPLVLAFYFSARGEKIVQLIILRNQSGT